MPSLQKLAIQIVEKWARPKGLILHTQEQALRQHSKTVEEVGELKEAIARYPRHEQVGHRSDFVQSIELEAGDVLVTLAIQCAIQGYGLSDAIASRVFSPIFSLDGSTEKLSNQIEMWTVDATGLLPPAPTYVVRICGELINAVEEAIAPYNLMLEDCLDAAWEKIRDRNGETIDGVFVKSEDLPLKDLLIS